MAGGINRLTELEVKAHLKDVRARRKDGAGETGGQQYWKLSDGGGLFLWVTKKGTAVWRVKYRFHGDERTFSAGTYPEVSLQAARLMRAQVKDDLAKGRDPVQARRMSRAAAVTSAGTTFASVAEAWLTKSRPGWSQAHYETTADTLERYAGPLRSFPVAEITDPMVGKLIEHVVVERGSIDTARKLRQSLAGIFRYAMARGFCIRNPADSSRELIPRKRQIGRRPALLEFAALGDILRRASAANLSNAVRMAHRLTAFTAARVGNVIAAEWSEFTELDREVPTWVIPRAKMKVQDRHEDHRVILGPSIAEELRAWRRVGGSGRYLFPSLTDPNEHIVSEALSKLYRVTLGLKKTHTPHGWRAAFSTLARENGFDKDAVEMALDHVHASEVVRAYDRGARLPERIRLAQWWCEQLVKAERGEL